MTAAVLAALLLAASPAAGASSPEADRAALARADEALARAVDERDAAAFLDLVCEDAVFGGATGLAEGRAAVRERWKGFFAKGGPRLAWGPDRALAAASGDLGITVGHYRLTIPSPDGGSAVDEGRYATVWRKGEDARWRVLFDMGLRPASELGPGLVRHAVRIARSRAADLEAAIGTFEGPEGDGGAQLEGLFITVFRRGPDGAWLPEVDSALETAPRK